MIAMDCASSELYTSDKKYNFKGEAKFKKQKSVIRTTDELVKYLDSLIKKYPHIISIEDGFAESD
jgi:enolase